LVEQRIEKAYFWFKTVYAWALQHGCKKVSDTLSRKPCTFSKKFPITLVLRCNPSSDGAALWAAQAKNSPASVFPVFSYPSLPPA
jgi:hypothetical protein